MAQVTCMKRGSKWQYRFEGAKINGKRKRFTKGGFATKKEALEAGTKALAEYNNSGLRFVPSEMSFSDYLDFWMKEYCQVNLKEVTCSGYQKRIKNHIKPGLGHYRLRSLTPAVLQTFINEKFNEGYSRNSLTVMRSLLSGCLSYAVEPLAFIQSNPMQYVRMPSPRAKAEIATRKKERQVVSTEEWNTIIQRFPYGSSCHIPLLLAYRCGLRLGEAFALTWDDIDFNTHTLSVNKQVQNIDGKWMFSNPKYDSFRDIKLDIYMLEILKKAKEQQMRARLYYAEYFTHLYVNSRQEIIEEKTDDSKEIFLVNVRENGTYIQPRVMQHCGRVIHYDLGFKNYDYHSLRHTHATMLLEKGANIKDVQHRLGHKNVQVTLQIYTHTTEKMQNQTIEILNQIPADGFCTPNFTHQPEELPVFTRNSAKILPFNFSEKPRIFKGSETLHEELGVQNCTPKQELGYNWGTNDENSSKNTIFDNKKEPLKKQPFSL